MKIQLLIITAVILSTIVKANELVIEVTTDKYPNETTWTLFDTNRNIIKQNGALEKHTTHYDTVQVDVSLCYFWTIYDSYGDGMSQSDASGDYKLYIDGELIAQCADPNFGDSISVYGIGSNCSDYDIMLEELTFNNIQSFAPFELTFDIINIGNKEVNTLELWYSIGGWESETIILESLTIVTGQKIELGLPDFLQIMQPGNFEIGLHVSKINGIDDEYAGNNFLSETIEVKNGYWKKPMHEIFTASTCSPCKPSNENLDEVLSQYDSSLYSLVKYQVNWPGNGDPYYTADVGKMKNLYSVSGVPSFYVDLEKQSAYEYTTDKLDSYIGLLTDIGVETTAKAIGDSIFVDVSIASKTAQSNNLYLRLSVVEKTTYDNVGTNGETEFHNVFMKFLSNWEGDDIGVLEAGNQVSFSYAKTMSETFVEQMDDLRIVACVFKLGTYEILQSDMVEVPFVPAPPYISFNIENDAANVDTTTTIILTSTKKLYNLDGTDITEFYSLINFKKSDAQGDDVAYSATISGNKQTITITPDNYLIPNMVYYVELKNVKCDEGIEVTDAAITFTTINTVAITDNGFTGFRVYPNPANSFITINTKNSCEISVLDYTGKTVYRQFVQPGNIYIDISNFKPGLYLINAKINGINRVVKITIY